MEFKVLTQGRQERTDGNVLHLAELTSGKETTFRLFEDRAPQFGRTASALASAYTRLGQPCHEETPAHSLRQDLSARELVEEAVGCNACPSKRSTAEGVETIAKPRPVSPASTSEVG